MLKEKKFSLQSSMDKASLMHGVLTEHKAKEISFYALPQGNPLADIVILCTATSARHGRSLADAVVQSCKDNNLEHLHTEGYAEGEWILVDLNDIILHIFQEAIKERYKIEEILADATSFIPGPDQNS